MHAQKQTDRQLGCTTMELIAGKKGDTLLLASPREREGRRKHEVLPMPAVACLMPTAAQEGPS
jgi:hypothetical protein